MLNAVTPFITPDPPWLANLPLVVATMAFLLAFWPGAYSGGAGARCALRNRKGEPEGLGAHEP